MDRYQTLSVAIPISLLTANNAIGVAFVVLKALGRFDHSWWVALLPFYAGNLALVLLGFAVIWVLLGVAFSFGRIRLPWSSR